MNFRYRRAGAEDLNELRQIGIRSYLPHYSHLWKPGGIDWYMERCFGKEFLEKEISAPNIEYYFVENDVEIIGLIKLVLKKPLPDSDTENALYLEKIYFVKEWTGKGAGRAALEFIFERARELNSECVWLMAMDSADKPIEAYKRAGFEIHSYANLGEEFALMKEEFRGMVVMKHYLKNNGN
jgi:GNAT superfamily N-acetyltransferase